MLKNLIALFSGKTAVAAIVLACIIILGLGCAGVISWSSPIEKAAEQVLKSETGLDVKPESK